MAGEGDIRLNVTSHSPWQHTDLRAHSYLDPVRGSPHPLPDLLEAQPVAARWDGRRQHAFALGPYAVAEPVQYLHESLRYPGKLFSERAVSGFYARAQRISLRLEPGLWRLSRLISTGCGSDTSALPRSDRRTFPDTDDPRRRLMARIRQRGTRRELVVRRALVSYTPGSAKRRPEPGGDGDAEFDPVPTGTSWRRGAEPFD
jgi:hypothetical protein